MPHKIKVKQYVTDCRGEKTGVILDIREYRRLKKMLKEVCKTKPYFVTWHDYIDGVSHGKIINVLEGDDPESEAYDFLADYVGKDDYLLEGIKKTEEGEDKHEF